VKDLLHSQGQPRLQPRFRFTQGKARISRNSGFSLQKRSSSSVQAVVSVHSCSSTNWLAQGNAVWDSSEDCGDCGAEWEIGQNRSEVLPFSATPLPPFLTVSSNVEPLDKHSLKNCRLFRVVTILRMRICSAISSSQKVLSLSARFSGRYGDQNGSMRIF
jgi:hypothetical protein